MRALDVEVADLLEIEKTLVITRPIGHAATVNVMCHVVHPLQAVPERMAVDTVDEVEIDVVDGLALLETVNQV